METWLMPGMDGTGRLFAALEDHLDPALRARAMAYSSTEPLSYEALAAALELPASVALVAESFSGPLAIRLAAEHPDKVRAVVLVGSFVRCPIRLARWIPGWLRRVVGHVMFRLPPPTAAVRWALAGRGASRALMTELLTVSKSIAPEVMAHRLEQIITVDAREALAGLQAPMLYLAGRQDRLVGPRALEEIKALRPEMAVVELDAPHLIAQRRPAEAAELINSFLRQPSG